MALRKSADLLTAKAVTEYVDILASQGLTSDAERAFWSRDDYGPVRSELVELCVTVRQLSRRFSPERRCRTRPL